MTSNRILYTAAAVALVLLVGLGVLTRWVSQVDRRLEDLGGSVATLAERLDVADGRAEAAEKRATEAERLTEIAQAEAQSAQAEAAEARGDATAARQQAQLAEEQSRVADQQRLAAVEAQRAAEREKEEALEREAEALARATAAYEAATAAEMQAARARAETAELQRRRERELSRLESALSELTETRRTALGLVMNLGNAVEFDFDKADLRPENREILARIAGVLLTAGDYSIQVFGHTDDIGDDSYNVDLSKRRAQSVVDYLVESGIQAEVISAQGLGNSQPLVEGTDEAARQRNRRVEIAVVSYNEEFVVDAPP